jgi:hypothetical protein
MDAIYDVEIGHRRGQRIESTISSEPLISESLRAGFGIVDSNALHVRAKRSWRS